mgnify:CR=1 FL=1
MKEVKLEESAYQFDAKMSLKQAIPLGLQHVCAMFVGNLTPLLIITSACGIAGGEFADLQVTLLQSAMFVAGVVTLVQLFTIGPVGGSVPIIMGTSSGFIGVFNSVVGSMGGGVSMDSRSGSFTMNGGSITDCATGIYSSNAGGGVSVERGTFALAGGTIQNCQANEGAGVYVSEDGTFIMTDGIIQNCVANKNVGALYINGGTMNAGGGTVDGTVMINTGYDYNSNSDIPGVIQDIAGSFDATEFKQDVINAGEIKHGTFSGKVIILIKASSAVACSMGR